jgi:hypothetical protein
MSRWVRIDCDIFDHELFDQSELSEREAWIWLITRAAWKDTRHRIGADMVPVPRGSMFATLRQLASAWGWKSDYRVRSFLDSLEKEAMIKRYANAGKTQITICNYSKFQDNDGEDQRKENASETQGKRKENAQKIPIYQDTKDTAAAIAGDAIEIADRCIEALGPAASPISIGLQSSCPASRWIADGADLEADILPVMRRYAATKPPGSIRAWQAWMGQDVANHRATRLSPLPEGRATGPPSRKNGGGFDALEAFIEMERRQDETLGSGKVAVPRLAIAG